MATTLAVPSVFADPARIDDPWEFARQLSAALDLDTDDLFRKLAENRRKRFVWIKRRITASEQQAVLQRPVPRDAVGLRTEYQRVYPMGRLAAHVLGLRTIDGEGRGGIEESCDRLIRGTEGRQVLMRDATGRVLDVDQPADRPAQPGRTVRVTVDAVIQLHAENVLDTLVLERAPKSACAIVMEPRTGDILALVSRPDYDPNSPNPSNAAAWKNTAVASVYEPGSTFKPFIVAWALQTGVLQRDEIFDCENGAYRMGRRILHDHHPYGELSVTDILVKSSNIGMAKIGERLTNAGLYEATQLFGFGRRTGIPLPGELEGTLRPLREWNSYSTGSIPMGQELAVTPIQLMTAHAALANGGVWQSPRLIGDVLDRNEQSIGTIEFDRAAVVSDTVDPDIAQWLIEEPMVQVVERGTGKEAQIKDYRVFGKTGTAQKTDPETGTISNRRHLGSFLCGAPAENPRLLVLVVVDEPSQGGSYYGGIVAAPYAARILQESLRLLGVGPQIATKPDER